MGELLKRVAEDYGDAATTIDAALSQGDPLMARRLVHTLRSVAGSIGATALQDAATAVEQSLRMDALPEESLVQTLVAALAQTLASIALVRRARVPSPRLDSPAGPALKRRLRELLVSLERQALNADELFHSLRQSLLQAQQELPVEPLGRCIERLDFNTASRLLRELASRLGIPLEGGDLAG